MSESGPDVRVDAVALPDAPVALILRAVHSALAAEGMERAHVSVALLPDGDMRELNRRYLDRDEPTDVLAFTLGTEGTDAEVVGDVYVGFEQATRQATELGIPVDEELARLAIHGTLHVLGHDHPEGSKRAESAMFALQERLLAELVGHGASRAD